MEQTYQYAWIIPLLPLTVPILIGVGLFIFPTATKNIRRVWAFQSILLLSIAMVFSIDLSIHQINSDYSYQYVWSWVINNDLSLELGFLIDPLTSIMLILITTVGILVLIYSDKYMSHDQGYLRFFSYMSLFSTSMLGLVTSSNLLQIYVFWELVGMCSYLLIGFWFTRPLAASACQKAFVTNRVGDFGLLLGILGFYWLTGSFEFRSLVEIITKLISKNEINFVFLTICAVLLFAGSVAKSAQFPLHVWLPDAMEGPTPISALIHAATMVAAGIFLVARLFPLFIIIPHILNVIAFTGILTVFLGATLALAQKDIKRGLAYSTMSQLGYMMLALGMGSYRAALFHLITHAYSKALLFLGSGSVIHSMEPIVGYAPSTSQNMAFMGGLTKHSKITKIVFLIGTLSLCGIPPLACFWSKDEILNDSWLYSPIFAIIASFTAGLTAFYMFRIYLLTFEGHLNAHFQKYSGKQSIPLYSISLWGKEGSTSSKKNNYFFKNTLNNKITSSFLNLTKFNKIYNTQINIRTTFSKNSNNYNYKEMYSYPYESENTMVFPLLILALFTFCIGTLGIPFNQDGLVLDILTKWLRPSINLLHLESHISINWYEFFNQAILSVSISFFGICIASFLYKPVYSSFQNWELINSVVKRGPNRFFWDKISTGIYNWSNNRGYIDSFYTKFLTGSLHGLAEFTYFFDTRIIDSITNGIGVFSFIVGESIKYVGSGRISSYLLLYLIFLLIFLFLSVLNFQVF
uniref:NAD(P)H-quinone oxidoreductase subunit 5, chloroplastic n=1 Tax=Hydrostachys imbricata TaxID=86842 RepID=A0A5C0PZE1_9ASTE|nr:NdhF [Hydrostachys imbricata]QEJ82551.1 NdhF [Hydrostachys imbricata]